MKLFIKLGAIVGNLHSLSRRFGCKLIFMVKANAYGLGAKEVAKHCEKVVAAFGVAVASEALELLECGIKKDIIIFQPNIFNTRLLDFDNVVYAFDNIRKLEYYSKLASLSGKLLRVHLAIDSGMNRYGIKSCDRLFAFCKTCATFDNVGIEGVYTHFYSQNIKACERQYGKFLAMERLVKRFFPNIISHIGGSNAMASGKRFVSEYLRVGISAYGYDKGMVDATEISADVIEIKFVKKGEIVGYDEKYLAKFDTLIAVCQGGYADGLERRSEAFPVIVNFGKTKCDGKIVGKVCMDCFFVELCNKNFIGISLMPKIIDSFDYEATNECKVEIESIKSLAKFQNRSVYEVLTGFGLRVERIYI